MSILYGLTAAAGFGVADFFATTAARQIGVLRTLFAVQAIGLLSISALILAMREPPSGSASAWLEMAVASVVSFVGVLCLYRAFAVGTLSLVSPIASGFAVVSAGIALAAGERPPGLAIAGAGLLIAGVTIVSRSKSEGAATIAGIPEAIGATMSFGVYFWAVGELTSQLGVYWPVFVNRSVEVVLALGVLWLWPREPIAVPAPRTAMPALIAAALFDTIALIAFNLGVDSAYTTTTTALTSLYSAFTVLLAWALMRERLARMQWAGVGIVLAGVFLVSI